MSDKSVTSGNELPLLALDDLDNITSFGTDLGRGNLVGVQPFMHPVDYTDESAFHKKLDGYLAAAQETGWLQANTIVVFPEYIGTWLVVAGERSALFVGNSLSSAVTKMVLGNFFRFLRTIPRAQGRDRARDAIFRMKSESMAQIYQRTFGRLARRYAVTIVAGSIVLPSAEIVDGELVVGSGELQNVGVVFRPDGSPYPDMVRKIYATSAEAPFTTGGSPDELPLFETAAGRLAVLICADSWYPAAYKALAPLEPDLIAVPNNETPAGIWDDKWHGYDPGPQPADVAATDVGSLTNGQAWLKYALAGRLHECGAKAGIHVFFRGQMWDLTGSGHTIVATKNEVYEAPRVARAALVNYWLS